MKSLFQIVITASVEMSPDEFIERHNTILIERVGLHIHSLHANMVSPIVEDFEIIGIEEL